MQTGELKEGDEAKNDDFELWSPKHPDGCLFGHVAQYHRKIPSHNCYIGKTIKQPHKILENCACTRRDYEWYAILLGRTYLSDLPLTDFSAVTSTTKDKTTAVALWFLGFLLQIIKLSVRKTTPLLNGGNPTATAVSQ